MVDIILWDLKGKSVKIDDITPKEKEYVFHEIDTTISDEEKVLGEVIRRLHNYDEKIDYLYIVKYNENGKHKIIRRICFII